MLYEFKKGSTVKNAVKNICDVYGKDVLRVRKCQRWFFKFRNRVLDLPDKPVF
ncbi:hypothetical protein WH47_11180 [Habropoda laboriosa]|uniref:Mos1 transposase HTH domain-containing protein n=1 Tax=Habropoda laboriosa TaxID=597456 RepID=A0A0L7RAA9_9HYME|nr:hypothetical protein WH47_11180 [Habropoda laboriosa]